MAKANPSLKAHSDLVNEEIRLRFNNKNKKYSHNDLNNNNTRAVDETHKLMPNFKNAVYNRDFLESTNVIDDKQNINRQQYQTQSQESSIVNLGKFIGNEPVYMVDDIALLPHIDDKTLLNVIKNNFETQKFHVRFIIKIYLNITFKAC